MIDQLLVDTHLGLLVNFYTELAEFLFMVISFKNEILLENNNVRLEPLQRIHLEELSGIVLSNPGLLKYSPPKFGTVELLKKYIDKNVDLRASSQKYPFIIFDKSTMEYAGSTSYLNISIENQRLEIGSTWIGKRFQRTGLNRNCKFLLMQYAFEVLEIERLEFKTDKRNIQSQTAIQKVGGKYEGLLRSHTLMSDGHRRDTVYYSVLRDEWPGIKATIFKNFH